jgi:mono/diheme cytochrome c family protein
MNNSSASALRFFASRRVRRMCVLVFATTLAAACGDVFTTFARQPAIHPWQVASMIDSARLDSIPPRGNPVGSIPLHGGAVPEWAFSYSPLPPTLDSMAVLVNPRAPTPESINNGHRYYQINCAVCHGSTGAGDGAVTKLGMVPIPLLSETARAHAPGTLFGIIRNGKGSIMPSYNRIEVMDRWDVVNYVLGLQGRLNVPIPTGPLGTPGETGGKIPGPTMTAPQRAVPHYPPSKIGGG